MQNGIPLPNATGTNPFLVVLTPTCDRPAAFVLCERWVSKQTLKPDLWIVSDGGQVPVRCMQGQTHLHNSAVPPGAHNFLSNLQRGLKAVPTGEHVLLVIMEDDDYYFPSFLAETVRRLATADATGGIWQPYYNLRLKVWKRFHNRGSCLCQTGLRAKLIPWLLASVQDCWVRKAFGVDGHFWDSIAKAGFKLDLYDAQLSIGIKGLPGQAGLGVGHRPKPDWIRDPQSAKLREWVGAEAETYLRL